MADSRRGSSFLTWTSYIPTETYFILIKAYCFVGTQTLRNLSGDLSARILGSRYGWASKASGQQRIHGPWNCYRMQSQRGMYVMCGYLMEFKPSCLFGLIMRRLYLRLLGGERAVHSFSSFLVCEMLLLTQWCRWNVHHSNVVRMKILRPKEKKNLPAGFHLPTLARSGCICCSIELGAYGDQGAFLDHPVTCAEWLAKKPGRDEKTTSKNVLRALGCPAGSGSKI